MANATRSIDDHVQGRALGFALWSGHTWHHSDRQLIRVVKEGLAAIVLGYETDMLAYSGVLDNAQIEPILEYIKGTWPKREREIQQGW